MLYIAHACTVHVRQKGNTNFIIAYSGYSGDIIMLTCTLYHL